MDGNGDLRWRDINQRVEHNPNRTGYQDDDGVWRWSDTDQPVDEAAASPDLVDLPFVQQDAPSWCGAAAGEMVAHSLGVDVTQEVWLRVSTSSRATAWTTSSSILEVSRRSTWSMITEWRKQRDAVLGRAS